MLCTDESKKIAALETLALILYRENKCQEAYHLLLQGNINKYKNGKCLLCKLAYKENNFELIAKYSAEIYAIEPTHEIAVLNQKAFTALDQPDLAEHWRQMAIQIASK